MPDYVTGNTEIYSGSDREDSDEENSNEENPNGEKSNE